MVGTIQIKCSAHNPSMPLCPVFAFQDSYQQVRISDVPKKIGDWNIKRVEVECLFPDNRTMRFDGELVGGVWAATITSCPIAGTSKNGFVVNGYDENGNKYVLGKSDLYIMTNDQRIVPQKEIQLVNILPNKPDAPHVGDAVFVDGKFEVYDGETWVSTGSSDGYTKEETDNAILSALSAKEDAKYIESEDGKRRIYGNGDVYNLSSTPGTYGPWTDKDGNVDDTWRVVEVVDSTFWYIRGYDWGDRSVEEWPSREAAENAKTFSTNDGNVWTKPYIPGPEEWVKEDELSLKSDFDLIATTYATKDELPTKTSQLENDSGFINGDDVPTKTSQLVNDSEFADKNFVNSSIATNTANFKGTYESSEGWPTDATNNDYLFLKTVDENGNTIYKRYKYIASTSTWTYEYTLNNSSFTAEQWATINNGPYASTTDIPTKTSELENDSGFITDKQVKPGETTGFAANSEQANMAIRANQADSVDWDGVNGRPTKLSQFDNDSGYVTRTGTVASAMYATNANSADSARSAQSVMWSGVNNTPTTLEGYGITDAATNASVDEKIGGVTSSIPTKTSQLDNDSDFADKNFVNSSIATNTANFKGTFNNESEFPTEATNNDYLFWNTVDENGNTIYKRYKYIASTSTWTYEYTLNNSSFTAEQWATINGGPYASVGDIPTKVSQLDNDSNFATKTELDTVNRNLTTTVLDMQNELSTKATNASVDEKIGGVTSSIPTKTSQIENDSGYTTQAYVDNAIGNVLTQEEF